MRIVILIIRHKDDFEDVKRWQAYKKSIIEGSNNDSNNGNDSTKNTNPKRKTIVSCFAKLVSKSAIINMYDSFRGYFKKVVVGFNHFIIQKMLNKSIKFGWFRFVFQIIVMISDKIEHIVQFIGLEVSSIKKPCFKITKHFHNVYVLSEITNVSILRVFRSSPADAFLFRI